MGRALTQGPARRLDDHRRLSARQLTATPDRPASPKATTLPFSGTEHCRARDADVFNYDPWE